MSAGATHLRRGAVALLVCVALGLGPTGLRDRTTADGVGTPRPTRMNSSAESVDLPALQALVERDPFRWPGAEVDPPLPDRTGGDREPGGSSPERPVWTVHGIVVGSVPVAVIEGSSRGSSAVVGLGEEVDGWIVSAIDSSSIQVARGVESAWIELPRHSGSSP